MAISSELEQLLASWIPRQPWFPKLAADFGNDPDITPMSVARAFTYTAEELGGFVGLVTVISVGDGPTLRRLNIPLTLRGSEDMHLRHALIGHIDELALGPMYVYDGAADPVFVNLMADAITKRKVFDGGQLSTESLRHSQEKTAARDRAQMPFPVSANGTPASATGSSDTPAEVVPPKPSRAAIEVAEGDELPVDIRPIEVTDSGPHKSTVIIHDEYEPMELSFFRVLENGMPSSLTIPVLLTEAGSRSVPEVIGWGSGRWYDMFEVQEMEAPMALLSHVDVEAEPAWREAVDTVCAVDSGSIGAYNAHAAEMGRRIGELHADMAAEFGVVEGAGEPTKQLVAKWIERIDWALGRAPLALDALVPELRAHRSKVQGLETIGTLQKIHGELTLDHVVSSPSDGYSVVKFTDSTNSDPKPAALDLVALLRSIDYAAGFARLQRTDALDSEDGTLVVNGFGSDPSALRTIIDSPEYLWASQVQNSLLSGYSRARGESVGLNDPVLRAALVDRLLVEVVTELRNRPNWLSVPLATLTLVLKGRPSRTEDPADEVGPAESAFIGGAEPAETSSAESGGTGSGEAERGGARPGEAAGPGEAEASAPPRGTSGAVAAAISTTGADGAEAESSLGEEDAETASAAGLDAADSPDASGDESPTADTAENTIAANIDSDIDDAADSTVVPPHDGQDHDDQGLDDQDHDDQGLDREGRDESREDQVRDDESRDGEEFDDEEAEVPVQRVPATFAARGATSEDADSTGHDVSKPAKPAEAPKLGRTWNERSHDSEGEAGKGANRETRRSAKGTEPAAGSVFDELLGTARKRDRMKKRKND